MRTSCGHVALLMGTDRRLISPPLRGHSRPWPRRGARLRRTQSVTLSLQNVPVQTALRTLFSRAGVSSYVIDPDVQGYASVQVSDVPFTLALRQLLRSVQSPLDFTADNGAYHVTLRQAAPSAQADAPSAEIGSHSTEARSIGGALNDSGNGGRERQCEQRQCDGQAAPLLPDSRQQVRCLLHCRPAGRAGGRQGRRQRRHPLRLRRHQRRSRRSGWWSTEASAAGQGGFGGQSGFGQRLRRWLAAAGGGYGGGGGRRGGAWRGLRRLRAYQRDRQPSDAHLYNHN